MAFPVVHVAVAHPDVGPSTLTILDIETPFVVNPPCAFFQRLDWQLDNSIYRTGQVALHALEFPNGP